MANVSLRGIDEHIKKLLKTEATKQGTSVNGLILSYIHKGIGTTPTSHSEHHELDSLAGTWSDGENEEFLDTIRHFEQIDEEMWK